MQADDYEFTTDWFTPHWDNWLSFTGDRKISKILEIGSFEGRSTCAMIDHFGRKGPLHMVCVDSWQGSPELQQFDMAATEQRFNAISAGWWGWSATGSTSTSTRDHRSKCCPG